MAQVTQCDICHQVFEPSSLDIKTNHAGYCVHVNVYRTVLDTGRIDVCQKCKRRLMTEIIADPYVRNL